MYCLPQNSLPNNPRLRFLTEIVEQVKGIDGYGITYCNHPQVWKSHIQGFPINSLYGVIDEKGKEWKLDYEGIQAAGNSRESKV